MERRFYLENFGCRATQADGAAIERQLLDKGLARAENFSAADVVVLNTCTVTSAADQDARSTIRRIHRENPGAQILVTGCYAQRSPEEIAQIPGVSIVVGNSHKHQLADIADRPTGFVPLQSLSAGEVFVGDIFAHTELMAAPVFEADTASEKTRPNLKIQDGCNNRCSFCIIPYVRGKSRSLRLDEVIRETRALAELGYKEIVLSGINLGRWGRDIEGRSRFADLLRAILAETAIAKIRISSVEPMDWSDDLIELVASSPRICKHAHVPLQSGSDRILRKMHRKYRPWHYADRIQKIRAAMPTAAIGADVMVGFPGETDADFEETRAFIDSLPFTYLHVFTYSSRPGTPSASMPNQVRGDVTRERNRILRELAARKKRSFQQQFIGHELQAITLTNFENGRTEALTDNFQKLWLKGRHDSNLLVTPRIIGIDSDALIGTPLQSQ
ncbi:MAG TPA: tRNA (N(6)-L-threonylcarbamoyladenosine(37)-C(2))-methylthiotransferase MtaB [Terriglobales bacterium]|nr:tRNA (N(6)-L-threonylcarbamoyladenosine(37)-C(2))-methylthiotransferase MtaB [Terriglobales bacterium]